ncbi:DUF1254 domain-containing protein [Aureimonas fodinaquatilis]|uniref:DUF1254 domain-containing protein n=2 Tax=Aureimonas fodinaquatilis TaxID=2565783 RepID=A0A5B0E163_9HYPH|nr:DUF1254 domain-containing protein [Aureimonas fodinaquatilis]
MMLSACLLASPKANSGQPDATVEETREIARDAYVYGVPIVTSYATMYAFSVDRNNSQYKGPFNSLLNIARVFTPEDTAFVTPNSDTPYTFIGLDLRAEPIVLTVPAIEKERYFVFQMMDIYTFNFDYLGTRATGNSGGNYLFAGPDWDGEMPDGIERVFKAETSFVNIVGRTQLFNPADLDNVIAIQKKYQIRPLSEFLQTPTPPAAPVIDWVKPVNPSPQELSPEFFNVLAFALQFAEPVHPTETDLRKRFERIGIVAGEPFDFAQLSPELQDALKAGMADGQKQIDERRESLGGNVDDLFGTRSFLENDYIRRAVGTQVGIGANSKEEAIYPLYEKDSDNQRLDGSTGQYRLRFAGGEFPPVNAFWSLTMYKLPEQFLVANAIDRYLINSPMLPELKKDADGGVTIYIQAESPGADLQSNWLPAPEGPFMLALRYYLPQASLIDGTWKSPLVERVR